MLLVAKITGVVDEVSAAELVVPAGVELAMTPNVDVAGLFELVDIVPVLLLGIVVGDEDKIVVAELVRLAATEPVIAFGEEATAVFELTIVGLVLLLAEIVVDVGVVSANEIIALVVVELEVRVAVEVIVVLELLIAPPVLGEGETGLDNTADNEAWRLLVELAGVLVAKLDEELGLLLVVEDDALLNIDEARLVAGLVALEAEILLAVEEVTLFGIDEVILAGTPEELDGLTVGTGFGTVS